MHKAECAKGCGPNDLPALCAACDRREPYVASPWFDYIFFLYRLQRGGCRFAVDELSAEEWLALADLREEFELDRERAMLRVTAVSGPHA